MDIYPLQIGVGLEDVETFGKYLGGTTANVAVAAARLGRRAAIITGVGNDPFGRFVRRALRELGVDDRHVVTNSRVRDAGHVLRDLPAGRLPALVLPQADRAGPAGASRPTSTSTPSAATELMWLSVTGLSEEPSRESHFAVLEARGPAQPFTVLDLDYRPMFWATPAEATEQVQRALPHVTVAVGNREECEVAVGETEPERAADALLDARGGARRSSSRAPRGAGQDPHRAGRVAADPDQAAERAGRRRLVRRVALPRAARRLAAGEDPAATPTRPGRSSPPGWSARPRCPRRPRSRP